MNITRRSLMQLILGAPLLKFFGFELPPEVSLEPKYDEKYDALLTTTLIQYRESLAANLYEQSSMYQLLRNK